MGQEECTEYIHDSNYELLIYAEEEPQIIFYADFSRFRITITGEIVERLLIRTAVVLELKVAVDRYYKVQVDIELHRTGEAPISREKPLVIPVDRVFKLGFNGGTVIRELLNPEVGDVRYVLSYNKVPIVEFKPALSGERTVSYKIANYLDGNL